MVASATNRLVDLREADGSQLVLLNNAPPVPSTVRALDPAGFPIARAVLAGQVYSQWVRLESGEEFFLVLSGGIA